ncbi:ATP-binding cassette sub-family C member 4-like [Zophobas morio]|uniref:ATP-binding cassette sub-family C member 4-like n=1 Tax=Zophobas morio TaxID=2755281 RepID=UPI00308321A9
MGFLQSLCMSKLLEYFSENKKLTTKEAYIYGMAVVLSSLLRVISFQFHYLETFSTGFFFTKAAVERQKMTRERDSRIRIMNDIIFRTREIKTYAWETPFAEFVNKIRRISMQHSILAVNLMSDLKVCITRIETFLLSDHESTVDTQKIEGIPCCKIYAHNLTAKWNPSQEAAIKNVDFILGCGQLVALTGDTGSGKSSLLQAILQELLIVDGNISQDGLISYASQNPWVFSATIQENIIFNETFNQNKYLNVLKICALEYDISLFSHGDKTLVGERGAMLSGGQKARINLARAIYKDADIYLLDNPLAAMDVCVAQHIFTQCILQYLKTKSVVLITHNLKFLNYSDKVYVLEDGRVTFSGKYETLKDLPNNVQENNNKTPTKLSGKSYKAQNETKEHRGSDKVNTYTTYLFANDSKFFVVLQLLLFILTQVFVNGSDVFLSFWINLRQNPSNFNTTILQYFSDVKCLYIYSGFILIMLFLFHMGSVNFVECCYMCSVKLHDTLFNKILYGTMKFFDNHASGRIINRISNDISAIDEIIPKNMYQGARQVCSVLGVYVVVNAVNYYMIVPTLVLLVIFYYHMEAFRPVLIKLKRITATRKSPIYTHVVATVDGLTTVKASKAQKHCDMYMIKIYSDLDSQMTSVERVAEYEDLTVEDINKNEINPPSTWPANGKILFQSVSMRYSPAKPFVLKNINVEFRAGEKIGIVGRTGAGKSSLINALFHLYEFEGTILIDNVDITMVPLRKLRSRIAIVSQDPVLFSGTIRENLNPFKEFTDYQLWSVLEEVNLKQIVSNLPSGLSSSFSEASVDFSTGQKQLMCLARAILKECTIIVLDEATAFLDLDTDKLIQATIQKRFHKATILRIAHRLDNVMNSDKIVVLDDGCVVEFGTPNGLLQNMNGYFYKYVHEYENSSLNIQTYI